MYLLDNPYGGIILHEVSAQIIHKSDFRTNCNSEGAGKIRPLILIMLLREPFGIT
jgi:hypothetical protein